MAASDRSSPRENCCTPERMSQYLQIHPANPQQRLISRAVALVRSGGVIVYPTDSCYALGCHLGDKAAMERIRRIRKLDQDHNFTLVCRDLSELGAHAKVDNPSYRLLKALTPGPYTFILKAGREVPRRAQNPRKKTIGLRVPANTLVLTLLESLGEPLMSSTLIMPGENMPLVEPQDIHERLGNQVDLVIDGGHCGHEPTTVVDLSEGEPIVLRAGLGDVSPFQHD